MKGTKAEEVVSLDGLQEHATSEQEKIDTIVRAFQRLPPNELERLNVDISKTILAGTQEAEQLFNSWKMRQEELQHAMKSLLKPAEAMANYTEQLKNLSVNAVNEKRQILIDLESLLLDIDNARDFHTIGAWPVLLQHLHYSYPMEVRTLAAWAVGSAMKNSYDYQLWLLENVEISTKYNTTGIDLLLQMLYDASHASNSVDVDFQKRALYAISSALRGNLDIQDQVLFKGSLEDKKYNIFQCLKVLAMKNDTTPEVMRRIWSLASDILEEREYIRQQLQDELEKEKFAGVSDTQNVSQTTLSQAQIALEAITSNPLMGDYFLEEFWVDLAVHVLSKYLGKISSAVNVTSEVDHSELLSLRAAVRNVVTSLQYLLKDSSLRASLNDDWDKELKMLLPQIIHLPLGLEPSIIEQLHF